MDMSESGVRPVTPARTGRDGARPRSPSSTCRWATASPTAPSRCASSWPLRIPGRDPPTRSKSPTAPPRPTTCWRWRCSAQGDEVALRGAQLHAVRRRAAEPGRQREPLPPAHRPRLGARLGRVRTRRQSARRAWSTSPIPTTPRAACFRRRPCGASWRAAKQVGAYLLADEVYLGRRDRLPAHAAASGG